MTISSEDRTAGPFFGNDVTTVFPFEFKVFANADVLVVQKDDDGNEGTLILDTDYTVTLNPDQDVEAGGSITKLSALASGYSLTLTSEVANLQGVQITNLGGFYPKVINTAFDRLTILIQQLATKTNRALKIPLSDGTTITTELPVAALRANKAVVFDEDGNATVSDDDYVNQAANAAGSAAAALASEVAALASEELAEEWAIQLITPVAGGEFSAKEQAIGTTVTTGSAKDWATKTAAAVVSGAYSAKEWATGVLTRGAASGGSAKDWANYTGGTVDNTEYSAKKYAADSETSAAVSAVSANAAAASAALVPLSKYNATTKPTVNEDSGDGYGVGSVWIDVTHGISYICVDATLGAAKWRGDLNNINVKYFGAVGDGVTDDSAAFIAAREAWKALKRTNAAPGANSNKLTSYDKIFIPAGDYLINSHQVFMDSGFTTRTVGMTWEGVKGGTQILYQPSTVGYLIYNNDAILQFRFKNIVFSANSLTNASFMYSTSAGGAQDLGFDNCSWGGLWLYGFELHGTNNNSEFYFNNCAVYGKYTAFLYSISSDQFLNYWFNESKCWSFEGTFLKMTLGGHIRINGMDFSDYNPATASVLYSLEGVSHSQGVCQFSEENCRYEIKSTNAKILYCEWPQGVVKVDGADESSQLAVSGSNVFVTREFATGETSGPLVKMTNSKFMGVHKYRNGNSSWPYKKVITYDMCSSVHYADFYSMFDIALTTGINSAGLANPLLINCCGAFSNAFTAYTAWAASTAYTVGQTRIAGAYVYTCTVAGTSGTSRPWGAGSVVDNTVTWAKQDLFSMTEWVVEGHINHHLARSSSGAKRVVMLGRTTTGTWINRVDASTPNNARVILPPNAIITGVYINIPAGASAQASAGTFKIFTDEASPTTFLNWTTPGNVSAGGSTSYTTPFNCGTSIGTRSIIFQAYTDVISAVSYPGIAWIEYICP